MTRFWKIFKKEEPVKAEPKMEHKDKTMYHYSIKLELSDGTEEVFTPEAVFTSENECVRLFFSKRYVRILDRNINIEFIKSISIVNTVDTITVRFFEREDQQPLWKFITYQCKTVVPIKDLERIDVGIYKYMEV